MKHIQIPGMATGWRVINHGISSAGAHNVEIMAAEGSYKNGSTECCGFGDTLGEALRMAIQLEGEEGGVVAAKLPSDEDIRELAGLLGLEEDEQYYYVDRLGPQADWIVCPTNQRGFWVGMFKVKQDATAFCDMKNRMAGER